MLFLTIPDRWSPRTRCERIVAIVAALTSLALSVPQARAQNIQYGREVSTIAGTGVAGYNGDGFAATAALLNNPQGQAYDVAGNLFIADGKNNAVRRIDATTGVITTVAGSGTVGTGCTDGTSAILCAIDEPYGVAVDSAGNLYIADPNNNVVRKVDASGNIAVFAGSGIAGNSGNGGLALAATFNFPTDLQFDASGANLYIADSKNGELRKVNMTTRVVTRVAGTGTPGFSGDTGQATAAKLNTFYGFAFGGTGDIFIADSKNYRIRRVDAGTGIISTVAGTGVAGVTPTSTPPAPDNGNGGLATAARFVYPERLTVDSGGNLIVADTNDQQIRRVDAISGLIAAYAGTGLSGTFVARGAATNLVTKTALGILQDAAGNTIYSEAGSSTVRKVAATNSFSATPVGSTGTAQTQYAVLSGNDTVQSMKIANGFVDFQAGSLNGCTLGTASPAGTTCALPVSFIPLYPGLRSAPLVTVGASGTYTLGLSGIGKGSLAALTPGLLSTLAGGSVAGGAGDGNAASGALLSSPSATAVDSTGNVYLADTANHRVRFISASTGIISTLAGNGTAGFGGDAGAASAALLSSPSGVAIDAAGNVYIADTGNSRVRVISSQTGNITTVAGNGTAGFAGDGTSAISAQLNSPSGVSVTVSGDVLIADTGNHRVRKVTISSGIIRTLAGTGTAGFQGDGAAAVSAQLNSPAGVWADPSGIVYVADTQNSAIRAVSSGGVISTVAGTGTAGYGGSSGSAASTFLRLPRNLTTDAAGDLFIADTGNSVVRMVTGATFTTMAGNGTAAFAGDGGPSSSGALNGPSGIALDGLGRIYIADTGNNRIRAVDSGSSVIAFTPQVSQTTSAANSVMLVNEGNTTLTLSAITPSGPFALATSSTCGSATTLTPGASCQLDITFAPTMAGVVQGSVTIASSSVGAAKSIMLSGTGLILQVSGPQTIIFAALPDVPYGAAPIMLTAAASSGLPVSYSVTGPARLSGTALTLTGAGSVSITAAQAGNASSPAANPVTRTLNVLPGTLTIKPVDQPIACGAAIPTLPYAITGLAGGDTIATALSGSPIIATTALKGSLPGSYTITSLVGSLAASNYNFVFSSGTLTITKAASATVLAVPSATIYSNQAVTLTATVASTQTVAPTGTVAFESGTVTLGNGTIVNGMASASVTFSPGIYSVIAAYGGDSIFASSNSSSGSVTSTLPPDFSLVAGTTQLTIPRGENGETALTITPVSGFTGTVNLSCSSLPADVACSFSPAQLLLDGSNTTLGSALVISTVGPSQAGFALLPRAGSKRGLLILVWVGFMIWIPAIRRRTSYLVQRCTVLLIVVGTLLALQGCGVRGGTANASSFTVTVHAAESTGKVAHDLTLSVVIQ